MHWSVNPLRLHIIRILCGYAIRSGRHPEGSQWPLGRPYVGPGHWLPWKMLSNYCSYGPGLNVLPHRPACNACSQDNTAGAATSVQTGSSLKSIGIQVQFLFQISFINNSGNLLILDDQPSPDHHYGSRCPDIPGHQQPSGWFNYD